MSRLRPRAVARGRPARHDRPVMRVAVVGSPGAGKTTFAVELGRRTGLPVIHLDRQYWQPGWIETPAEAWRTRQRELLAGDAWIVDGNYGATLDVRFARADTVIVLAPPRLLCVVRALRRSLRHHGRAVQAPGCPERLNLEFLLWVWRFPRDSRPRLDAALDAHRDGLRIVELTSPRAIAAFLEGVAAPAG
jgi:adenylate kinase family enzyme